MARFALGDGAFAKAFAGCRDPQLVLDDAGVIVAANRAANALPVPGDALAPGARLQDVLRDEDGRPLPADALLAGGEGRARIGRGRFGPAVAVDVVAGVGEGRHLVTLRSADRELPARTVMLAAVADASHDALCALDADGVVRVMNARAEVCIGYRERRLRGREFASLIVEDERADTEARVRAAMRGEDVFQHDTTLLRGDGGVIEVTLNLAPIRQGRSGPVTGVSLIVQDITARKTLERALRHQAERDVLTGLYNRRRFQTELHRMRRLGARHPGQEGAVLLFDVDDFKRVNDSHGHGEGDDMLRALARALTESIRETDIPARLGGDEFGVLMPGVDPDAVRTVGEKLLEAERAALAPWAATISAGTTHFASGDDRSADQVLADADASLYAAKRAGGDRLGDPGDAA